MTYRTNATNVSNSSNVIYMDMTKLHIRYDFKYTYLLVSELHISKLCDISYIWLLELWEKGACQ